MSEHMPSHGLESQFLTRRQLLELGAAGLLGCCGFSACGNRLDAATAQAATDSSVSAIDDGADAYAPAVRLNPPTTTIPAAPLWLPGDVILGGDRNGPKIVAITSDDGPTPPYTGLKMADDMKAVGKEGLIDYMMVANNLIAFPEAGKQLYDRGYGIANHSLTHASYVDRVIANEMQPAQDAIWSVLGYYPELFRSPGLTLGPHIAAEARRLGLPIISTTTDIGDWRMPRKKPQDIINTVSATIHPGNIILIHDGGSHAQTGAAFPGILQVIRDKGYDIVRTKDVLSTGILQKRAEIYLSTRQQIAMTVAEQSNVFDERINPVVEMQTYLETNSQLSKQRRDQIERNIQIAQIAMTA